MSEYILSIDAGTQSIRAMLVDLEGNSAGKVKIEIEPYFSERPGWAEQDPEYYWKTLCDACGKLMAEAGGKRDAVKCVTVTTQRGTMVNVDREGRSLRPAITWLDQRRADMESWPSGVFRGILKAVKAYDTVEHAIRQCEANWIRQNQPEIWNATHKYLLLSGFFYHRLTGEYKDSIGCAVGYLPFDYKKHSWAAPSDFKWKMFPMSPDILPELVSPSEIIGTITRRASEQTGIPEGLPVVAAASDKACEMLGSGCLAPEIACLSYGTTATVETVTSKYVEVVPLYPSYAGAVPGQYNTEFQIFRGFWMVSWFKKEFGAYENMIAERDNRHAEELFDEMIKDIPPGSMGLMLQPYWTGGIKIPGPEAKGTIIGFGDVHTKAHVYKAILEGLAYALREGLERTEKRSGVKARKLRVSGGGSQSAEAMQVTADVFNLVAERPHTFETSALGAAINAAVGMKYFSGFEQAVASMTRLKDSFEPKPANVEIYDRLYKNIYQKLYPKLKSMYSEIRDITGYPEI